MSDVHVGCRDRGGVREYTRMCEGGKQWGREAQVVSGSGSVFGGLRRW